MIYKSTSMITSVYVLRFEDCLTLEWSSAQTARSSPCTYSCAAVRLTEHQAQTLLRLLQLFQDLVNLPLAPSGEGRLFFSLGAIAVTIRLNPVYDLYELIIQVKKHRVSEDVRVLEELILYPQEAQALADEIEKALACEAPCESKEVAHAAN